MSKSQPPRVFMTPLLLICCLLLPTARAWGLCNDKQPDCPGWANAGECTKENQAFMQKECPHSCGSCFLHCRDVEEACAAWAKEGHCESNQEYMLKNCPTSCGVCSAKCYDKEVEKCGDWARHGECTKNPSILSTCPVSCGVCSSVCLDKLNDCPQWAAAGDCHKNRAFMLKECPNSCQLCDAKTHGTTRCEDRDRKQCLVWGDHECAHNPESLLTQCPSMCGVCTVACIDKHAHCINWAKGKEGKACEDDAHLQQLCPAACHVCSGVHERFEAKEEL